jgi:hypothetical protein
MFGKQSATKESYDEEERKVVGVAWNVDNTLHQTTNRLAIQSSVGILHGQLVCLAL